MIKILIVMEGERAEPNFFKTITQKFGLNAEFFAVGTNLYSLYSKCKSYSFECDVKDVLKELVKSKEEREKLDQKFAFTYLVFDADLQHKVPEQRNKYIDMKVLVDQNFPQLIEMAKHFTNETDPSIGKLYINYPMMESYRYCDSFSDECNLSATVPIDDVKIFKQLASAMKLSGISLDEYEKKDFANLIQMNIKRLRILSLGDLKTFLPYDLYQKMVKSETIAKIQWNKVQTNHELHIINTSIFLVVDYFGNRNSFYDNLFC